jgi:hypothetical protein
MTKLLLRQWHTYIGVFIAPSVLFFALTGAYQLFGLHEAHAGYQPPPVLAKLGMLHKKQVYALPRKGGRPKAEGRSGPGGEAAGHADAEARGPGTSGPDAARPGAGSPEGRQPPPTKLSTELLKWFFALVSVGLAISTALGVWIGLTHVRQKRLAWGLLVAGAATPLILLAL